MKTDEELLGDVLHHVEDMTTGTGNVDDSVLVRFATDDADRLSCQLTSVSVEGAYWVSAGQAEIEITRLIS